MRLYLSKIISYVQNTVDFFPDTVYFHHFRWALLMWKIFWFVWSTTILLYAFKIYVFSYSFRISFRTQDLALQQILSSIDLFLFHRTDYTDSRTLLNGCTCKCVRLSRPLVGFWTHFKSPHFHYISFISYSLLSFGGLGSKRSIEHVPVKPRPVHATRVTEPCSRPVFTVVNKMLSYRRETALQGALVFAESRRLELRDNILRTLYRSIFNHSDIIGQKICRIRWKKRKNKGY